MRCQVLLSFSQTVADLPDHECQGPKPAEGQPCYHTPCPGLEEEEEEEEEKEEGDSQKEELHDWEMEGFSECSRSCGTGILCLSTSTRTQTHTTPLQMLLLPYMDMEYVHLKCCL